MKVTLTFLWISLMLPLLLFGGCAPVTPSPGDGIGVLRVSGPNVWLNNTPARDGATVHLGNTLATGSGSSAILEFSDGGQLQLDQNTDPIFEWLEQSKCILVRIFKGQAYLRKQRACIEGPNISLVLDSEVNLLFQQPQSVVTLLRGSAEVTAPLRTKLVPGQQLELSFARAVPTVRTLSRSELQSVVRWRRDYRFRPLPVRQPEITTIPFPRRTRTPSGEQPPPKPSPTSPTEPGSKPPAWEKGIRLPEEMIRRDTEPVIR